MIRKSMLKLLFLIAFLVIVIFPFEKVEDRNCRAIQENYLTARECTESDTMKFKLIGTDSNDVTCSLKLTDVTILVGTTELSQSDLEEIQIGTINYPQTNKATCLLTLKGVPGEGQLKIKIAANTLTDSAGNRNTETTLATEVTMKKNTASLTINPNGGSVSITSPTGGTASTITTSTTFEQDCGTTLTYAVPTKSSSKSYTTYTTTFNYNGNGNSNTTADSTKTVTYNYKFKSWTQSSSFNGTLSSSSADGTYTFPSTGGTTDTITATYTSSTSYSTERLMLPTPTRSGYAFDGWYTAASGGTFKGSGGVYIEPTSSETLYAHWVSVAAGYASTIANNATTAYGKTVNYSAGGISDWKVFYADSTYIYLITSGNVSVSSSSSTAYKAITKAGMTTYGSGGKVWWKDVPGASTVTSSLKSYFKWDNWMDYSTYDNGKCVSCLLCTSYWSGFVDSSCADYAIGTPTLEMYVASWNAKGYETMYCNNTNAYGYYIGFDSNEKSTSVSTGKLSSRGYYDSLYYPLNVNNYTQSGHWLAAPSAYGSKGDRLAMISYYGHVSSAEYNDSFLGVRPVVRLKSGAQLTTGTNGYDYNISVSSCFVAGTKVSTPEGEKNIEDLQVGEKVYSYNEQTEKVEEGEVMNNFESVSSEIMTLTFSNGEMIENTPIHPYYVIGKGWTIADSIKIGDKILAQDKQEIEVVDKKIRVEKVKVYNLTVSGNHNYFVGKNHVLVHNKGAA